MKISEAANRIKVPIKKIRYYSDIGLIRPSRVNNGYRDFTENDLIKLKLIVKSRSFGFSIKECSTLIKLFENKSRLLAFSNGIWGLGGSGIDSKWLWASNGRILIPNQAICVHLASLLVV